MGCACLSQQMVVRAVAPNTAVRAFRRFHGDRNISRPQSGYYLLDPFGDAGFASKGLQNMFSSWGTSETSGSWSGHVGQPCPDIDKILSMFGTHDALLYVGHGEGAQKLLKQDVVQKGIPPTSSADSKPAPLRSVALLMGCSSMKTFFPGGSRPQERQTPRREFEAFGMPLNVLIGGGPAVVGALWDVLGGDLEILTSALLRRWFSTEHDGGLAGAIVAARPECRLPFLTGASVVCYGIPM